MNDLTEQTQPSLTYCWVDSIAHSEGDGEIVATPFGAVLHNTPRQMDIDTLRAYRNAIEAAICAYTSYQETGSFE